MNNLSTTIMYDFLSCIVLRSIALVSFLSYLTLENIVTLKSRLDVTQGYCEWHYSWHYSIDSKRVPIGVP